MKRFLSILLGLSLLCGAAHAENVKYRKLSTDSVVEGTKKYYTDALARAAVSSTATGLTYTGATGVFSLTAGYVIPSTSDESNWNSKQAGDTTLTSLAALAGVQGDIIYASGADAYAVLNKDANATRYLSNTGTTNNPAWAQVALTTGVSGTLPYGNGGTGVASFANTNGIVYAGATGLLAPTAALTSGRVPYATTNGRLTDSANFTGDGTNLFLNAATVGTSGTGVWAAKTGVAPTTSPADVSQLYSKDLDGTAGQAAYHMRGEDGNVVPLGMNLVNDAKGKMINSVMSIVTPSNVKLFLVFDRTGAVTALKDYSTIGGTTAHDPTLSANASTLTPSIAGMCPNLNLTSSAYFENTTDAADLSFGNGTNDSPLSIFALIKPNAVASNRIIGKYDNGTGNSREYALRFSSGSGLLCEFFKVDDNSIQIGATSTGTFAGDTAAWHTYGFTKVNENYAGIALYRDGAALATTDSTAGAYVAMNNGTAKFGSYTINTGTTKVFGDSRYGVVLVVGETLTAVQAARLDAVLRSYAGSDLN